MERWENTPNKPTCICSRSTGNSGGPVEPAYNVTQPWVKGHNGEYYMGAWNWNAVYARVWIDRT